MAAASYEYPYIYKEMTATIKYTESIPTMFTHTSTERFMRHQLKLLRHSVQWTVYRHCQGEQRQ